MKWHAGYGLVLSLCVVVNSQFHSAGKAGQPVDYHRSHIGGVSQSHGQSTGHVASSAGLQLPPDFVRRLMSPPAAVLSQFQGPSLGASNLQQHSLSGNYYLAQQNPQIQTNSESQSVAGIPLQHPQPVAQRQQQRLPRKPQPQQQQQHLPIQQHQKQQQQHAGTQQQQHFPFQQHQQQQHQQQPQQHVGTQQQQHLVLEHHQSQQQQQQNTGQQQQHLPQQDHQQHYANLQQQHIPQQHYTNHQIQQQHYVQQPLSHPQQQYIIQHQQGYPTQQQQQRPSVGVPTYQAILYPSQSRSRHSLGVPLPGKQNVLYSPQGAPSGLPLTQGFYAPQMYVAASVPQRPSQPAVDIGIPKPRVQPPRRPAAPPPPPVAYVTQPMPTTNTGGGTCGTPIPSGHCCAWPKSCLEPSQIEDESTSCAGMGPETLCCMPNTCK